MRFTLSTVVLLVLVLVAMVASQGQQVTTDYNEYLRKKAEYDRQKAVYDRFQFLKNVPVLPSNDLIEKRAPEPGFAEQLPPEYDGKEINFHQVDGPGVIAPGNSAQNFFTDGPIPAKKASNDPPPAPFVVTVDVGPNSEFSLPDPADAPPAVAPIAQDDELVPPEQFFAEVAAPSPSPAPAPAPAPALAPPPALFVREQPSFAPGFAPLPIPQAAPAPAATFGPTVISFGTQVSEPTVALNQFGSQYQFSEASYPAAAPASAAPASFRPAEVYGLPGRR